MYPHHEEKIRWDDYGEIIKPEDWIDPSAIANPGEANEDDINIDADDAQGTIHILRKHLYSTKLDLTKGGFFSESGMCSLDPKNYPELEI